MGRTHPIGKSLTTSCPASSLPDLAAGNSWEPLSGVEGFWNRPDSLASDCRLGSRDRSVCCLGVCSQDPHRGGRIRTLHGGLVSVSSGGARLPSPVPGSVQRRRCLDVDGILVPYARSVRMGRKEAKDFPRSRRGLRSCGLRRSPAETLIGQLAFKYLLSSPCSDGAERGPDDKKRAATRASSQGRRAVAPNQAKATLARS